MRGTRRPPRSHLFRAYLARGETIRDIAESYGVTYGVARRWMIYHDIPLRPRGIIGTTDGAKGGVKPTRPPNLAGFRTRAQTMNLGELAQHYDRDPRTIRRWLERYDVPLNDGRRADIPNAETLAQLRDDGMTLQQIGDRYGVTRQRVHQWLATTTDGET